MRVPRLRRIGTLFDDDCECDGPSFLEKVAIALIGGAAPIIVTYAISKLDPSVMEEEEKGSGESDE